MSKGHAVSEFSLRPQRSVFTLFGEGMNEWVEERMKGYRWLRGSTSPSPRPSQGAPWYRIHLPKRETQETRVPCPEDPLEQEKVTHSSLLAWKIPWSEELGGQQSVVWQTWTQLSTHAASIARPQGQLS